MGQVQAEATPQASGPHYSGPWCRPGFPDILCELRPVVSPALIISASPAALGPRCWGPLRRSLCRHTAAPGVGWPVPAQAQTPEVPSPGHRPWGLRLRVSFVAQQLQGNVMVLWSRPPPSRAVPIAAGGPPVAPAPSQLSAPLHSPWVAACCPSGAERVRSVEQSCRDQFTPHTAP